MERIKNFLKSKLNLVLVFSLVILLIGSIFAFTNFLSKKDTVIPLEEVELSFNPEGPYTLLLPRKDGNALVLNIKRVSSYEQISYEMVYQSEGVERGVQGTLDMKDKKSEHTQDILFGTCSTVDTFSIKHCAFDKDVENGTLTLKIKEGNKLYKMKTFWRLQKPDLTSGIISSSDGHFSYVSKASTKDLSNIGFTIVNDLTGVPKLPSGKEVFGTVYALNVPIAKTYTQGEVTFELLNNPPSNAQIARFNEGKNEWELLDTTIQENKLKAKSSEGGIFAILTSTLK